MKNGMKNMNMHLMNGSRLKLLLHKQQQHLFAFAKINMAIVKRRRQTVSIRIHTLQQSFYDAKHAEIKLSAASFRLYSDYDFWREKYVKSCCLQIYVSVCYSSMCGEQRRRHCHRRRKAMNSQIN